MSVVPQLSTDELLNGLIQMAAILPNWGWSVASLGKAYTATIFQEGCLMMGMTVQYGWMPYSSTRFEHYQEGLMWCMNMLYEQKRLLDTNNAVVSAESDGKAG